MVPASDDQRAAPGLGGGYWAQSTRPMTSLVFVAPFLAAYEIGVLAMGPESVRNGADAWLRELLHAMGFGQYFLLPALTVCALVCWHYTTREPWRLTSGVLSGMFAECVLLAFGLRLVLELEGAVFQVVAGPLAPSGGPPAALAVSGTARHAVGFLGAGVYEELLFRLMLLPAVAWTLGRLGLGRRAGLLLAVLSTSFAFAAAHYVGAHGEAFGWAHLAFWFGFTFRFLAGVFFSALFVYRGFGIAAGTHAAYDLLVGLF
jgi:membrane protease YdiL (CAAX protease family)